VPGRCGHCKKLEPEYETAAGQLKGDGIVLAKVDATEDGNKDLASKYGIQGFPTLKIFRGSEDGPSEYEGPRESAGIVSHLKKQFGPAFTEIKTKEEGEKATTPGEEISVVGVFPSGGDGLDAFKAAAESLRNDATFTFAKDKALVGGAEGVMLYRDFDDNKVAYKGKLEKVRWFCATRASACK
jgi:thiol-disulfide isomerase/thioredoxin